MVRSFFTGAIMTHGKTIIIGLDATTRNELAAMAYDRWRLACDKLKQTKAITHDTHGAHPSVDWPFFHAQMVKNAEIELELAAHIKEQICKHSPLILGE